MSSVSRTIEHASSSGTSPLKQWLTFFFDTKRWAALPTSSMFKQEAFRLGLIDSQLLPCRFQNHTVISISDQISRLI